MSIISLVLQSGFPWKLVQFVNQISSSDVNPMYLQYILHEGISVNIPKLMARTTMSLIFSVPCPLHPK
jgi:hypothetical protein